MKKSMFFLLLLSLMLSISALAAVQETQIRPALTFSGTTATCKTVISDFGKEINATMELWHGETLIGSWTGSATSQLILSGTRSLVSGQTYTLTVSGTIGGIAFTGTPVSRVCP